LSDHAILTCTFGYTSSRPHASTHLVPDPLICKELCWQAQRNSETFFEFLSALKHLTARRQHIKKIREALSLNNKQWKTLQDLENQIEILIRGLDPKTAHQIINRLAIIHPSRRDGGLMNCFLEGEELFAGHESVIENCLKVLGEISGELDPVPLSEMDFPDLPTLSKEEIKKIQYSLNTNRALTFDGFSDHWLRNTKKRKLIGDLWNRRTILALSSIFEARLCPLNKVWPEIPTRAEFRPIVILSPMFKFLEIRFLARLNSYLTNRLDRNQIGFVK
jgi:hypothetical protein